MLALFRPVGLSLIVLLAGFAFEAYNEPSENDARWERGDVLTLVQDVGPDDDVERGVILHDVPRIRRGRRKAFGFFGPIERAHDDGVADAVIGDASIERVEQGVLEI